jgi:SAM-dependent methyltransferase
MRANQISSGFDSGLEWYNWRAGQLIQRLEQIGLHRLISGDARVVEVGSGPVGVCSFFPAAERVAVDPLADEYARNPALVEARKPTVSYRCGTGEDLPCSSGRYDLAIIENCIDHVQHVEGVMAELSRVLKPDGVLYLTVNNRTRWGYVVHRLLSKLKVDRGHPHTFTPAKTLELIARSGFAPLDVNIGSYAEAKRANGGSSDARARLKALLGISEYLVSTIAVRQSQLEIDHGGTAIAA